MTTPEQPQVVQPSPVPTTWGTQGVIADSGQRVLVVTVLSPTGTAVYFLGPNEAATIAAQISQAADQLRTGLILPPNTNGFRPAGGK